MERAGSVRWNLLGYAGGARLEVGKFAQVHVVAAPTHAVGLTRVTPSSLEIAPQPESEILARSRHLG